MQNSQLSNSLWQLNEFGTNSASVVGFINKLLGKAVDNNASDIHFEPYAHIYRIRIRQDGILYQAAELPVELNHYFTARLKVMADLDIAERRLPQDGRFHYQFDKTRIIDCRVSTCPTLYGEKVVLRLLNAPDEILAINTLAMEPEQENIFIEAITHPQGIVLVTGPTGSGKTTTLYAALNHINTGGKNISTIEDPIEITLTGINQVAVRPNIGLHFHTALRAFLRQDPDVMMVGEMRDLETADIAVKAAQTGHLVLSTLHTNSAAQTLARLSNMGIKTFNLASSVTLIVAQRLMRRLCEHCKQPVQIGKQALRALGFLENNTADMEIYKSHGCNQCMNGYKGRFGIYELLVISDVIRELILDDSSSETITLQAQKEGMLSLKHVALSKVKQGLTSLEEINRVLGRLGS